LLNKERATDDAKPELLQGGLDEVPREDNPKKWCNGDLEQVMQYEEAMFGMS